MFRLRCGKETLGFDMKKLLTSLGALSFAAAPVAAENIAAPEVAPLQMAEEGSEGSWIVPLAFAAVAVLALTKRDDDSGNNSIIVKPIIVDPGT